MTALPETNPPIDGPSIEYLRASLRFTSEFYLGTSVFLLLLVPALLAASVVPAWAVGFFVALQLFLAGRGVHDLVLWALADRGHLVRPVADALLLGVHTPSAMEQTRLFRSAAIGLRYVPVVLWAPAVLLALLSIYVGGWPIVLGCGILSLVALLQVVMSRMSENALALACLAGPAQRELLGWRDRPLTLLFGGLGEAPARVEPGQRLDL